MQTEKRKNANKKTTTCDRKTVFLSLLAFTLPRCSCSSFFILVSSDGSSSYQCNTRRGWERDPVLYPGSERRSQNPRPDRPRLDSLDTRGEKERDGRSSFSTSSLILQPGQHKHGDSCSTCSSSSDSEEEGFFLGQRIPLPPQLQKPQPEEIQVQEPGERGEIQRDWSLRGSMRRRAVSMGAKDKDKNCVVS